MGPKWNGYNLVGYEPPTRNRSRRTAKRVVSSIGLFGIVFSVSYLYFLRSYQHTASDTNFLPPTKLVDANGFQLDDQTLRTGKAVLVFVSTECKACDNESEFLKNVYDKRNDVKFYAIVSFGSKESLKDAASKYPFGIYVDAGGLASDLNISRVPIKIFVNEGHMEKLWGGATNSQEAQSAFIKWLESVK
jgi:hypothetical protein